MNLNLISKLNANLFLLFIAGKLKTSNTKDFLAVGKADSQSVFDGIFGILASASALLYSGVEVSHSSCLCVNSSACRASL